MTTAAGAAVCDRRSLFFKCFGAHRAPKQLKNGSFHTDSKLHLALPSGHAPIINGSN